MYSWPKKAPLLGAFFVLVFWLTPATAADTCAPPQGTEPVKVRYVTDGDTLILGDNRKIRLIGINTPELAREEKPAQPLAIKARGRLRQLLFQHGNRVRLLYGKQQTDRYGRKLANLWLPNDSNLSAELLREGLGWMIAIPPNTRFIDCYQQAEKTAQTAGSGVWQQPDYRVKHSARMGLRSSGFQRVQGRIVRVNRSAGATWVNLEGRFALRIPDQDARWFSKLPDRDWIGRIIEVRGWVFAKKGELRMSVHHPAMLRFID